MSKLLRGLVFIGVFGWQATVFARAELVDDKRLRDVEKIVRDLKRDVRDVEDQNRGEKEIRDIERKLRKVDESLRDIEQMQDLIIRSVAELAREANVGEDSVNEIMNRQMKSVESVRVRKLYRKALFEGYAKVDRQFGDLDGTLDEADEEATKQSKSASA